MSDKVLGKVVYLDGTTYKRQPDGSLAQVKGETNWTKVDQLTESDLVLAAISDADAQPFTDNELAEFKPVRKTNNPTIA
ncbi:MAG: hypothetical protein RIR97_683 [Pseudomonadota bacterium]|jgi:alpha-acetolactate decarboxylase